MVEYDFSLSSFLYLLNNDADRLYIFLNKQLFRNVKLNSLKSFPSPLIITKLLKSNFHSLQKIPSDFSITNPNFHFKQKFLSTKIFQPLLLSIFTNCNLVRDSWKGRVDPLAKNLFNKPSSNFANLHINRKFTDKIFKIKNKFSKLLKKKLVDLLQPCNLLGVWEPLFKGYAVFQYNVKNESVMNSLVKFMTVRKVIQVQNCFNKYCFDVQINDKAQFKKYINEHPLLKHILESNITSSFNPSDFKSSLFKGFTSLKTCNCQPNQPLKNKQSCEMCFPPDQKIERKKSTTDKSNPKYEASNPKSYLRSHLVSRHKSDVIMIINRIH